MIKNKAVLNSDTVNKYGYCFSVSALEDALEQKALEGVPTCLGHDMHRPLGWTIPFGLYFEPGMCRLVGNQIIAENDNEQKFINEAHLAALKKRYYEQCSPYIDEFKQHLGKHLSENATYLYTGCVCYQDEKIAERGFPKLFENQDKDGLIYLSDLLQQFTYKGHGVFKDKDSELAVIAHSFFRKSLSIHNNLNYFLIDELIRLADNQKIKVRIALDRDMIGFAKTYHDTIELEYWRGPKFNNDVSKIKLGVTVYGSNEFQKLYYGISQTEFWWKHESGKQTLEVEELKEHPSKGIDNDSYGCRYVHSIFDEKTNSFEHFDGAIRMYDTDKMLMRIEKDIKSAGKDSDYTKLFRVDGELAIEDWKTLVCHYYHANPLIHEYFDEATENEPHIIKESQKTVMEELVPYSIDAGDGIRLLVSYHEIQKREGEVQTERYISGYDVLSLDETSLRVIESDTLEVVKALKRIGCQLDLPKNVSLAYSEDLYWNVPTISHGKNEKLETNVSHTLQALKMIFDAKVLSKQNMVASFTLSWERDDDKQVTISVMGHSVDIATWLNENRTVPIDKIKFREWLEKQSVFINKYPVKEDKPPIFEMVCDDGVQYIRRRGIAPEIKYQLKQDDKGRIMIGFAFPKNQFDLAMAYQDRKIDVALSYLHKKKICSECKGDYITCEHSKTLDKDVSVTVTDFELINVIWTDRKA
ncbi:MAG: hypothetical protein ACO1PI_10275 [Bacteroidota bacterium]